RFELITVTKTVASITTLDNLGCTTTARIDDQSNVSIDTITIMATSAATGICETHGFSATIKTSIKTPANKVERRPRPPYLTLLTVCPIMPQPAIPPNKLAAALAMPSPVHSLFLELGVSVRSSTTLAV